MEKSQLKPTFLPYRLKTTILHSKCCSLLTIFFFWITILNFKLPKHSFWELEKRVAYLFCYPFNQLSIAVPRLGSTVLSSIKLFVIKKQTQIFCKIGPSLNSRLLTCLSLSALWKREARLSEEQRKNFDGKK